MEWPIVLVLSVVVLLVLLALGNWIAFALAASGIVVLLVVEGSAGLGALDSILWNTTNDFKMTAIPLFLLLAEVVTRSGVGTKFFHGVSELFSPVRGSLLYSTAGGGAVFSAVSGSSVAGIAALGRVALPEMKARGYDSQLAYGSLLGVGAVGQLIPPSIGLIIYGSIINASVSKLFMAALVPGLILVAMILLYFFVVLLIRRDRVPVPERENGLSFKEKSAIIAKNALAVLPLLALIVLVMASIYGGFATPTEAAALGVAGALVLALTVGTFSIRQFLESVTGAAKTTVMLLFIILGAQVLSSALVAGGVTSGVVEWMNGINVSPFVMLLFLVVAFLVLGMFLEGTSMMLLTLPTLWPALAAMGYDPFVFGVIMMLLIEAGLMTPPVGLNLFVLRGVDREATIGRLSRAAIPIIIMVFITIFLVWFVPGLATWAV